MNNYRRPVKFKRNRIPRRHRKFKLKPNSAVLFVSVFVLIVIVATVMLGNHLKELADQIAPPDNTGEDTTDSDTTLKSDGISSITSADGSIRSGCLNISDYSSEEDLARQIKNIYATGFDSVTVPITYNGSLCYYSPAAITLSYMTENAELPTLQSIIDLIRSVGKDYGITPKVTAYYQLSSQNMTDPVLSEASFLFDTAIVAEAYSLGADEVLVSGFSLGGAADCETVISFIEKTKVSAPKIKLGLAFAPEAYATDTLSSYLETIAANTSFLAVSTESFDWSYSVSEETVVFTDENRDTVTTTQTVIHSAIYDQLTEAATSIKGSISLYGLRFLLNGDIPYSLAQAAEALYSKGAFDFYVVSAPLGGFVPDDFVPETDTDETEDEETTTKKEETKRPETTKPAVTTKEPDETDAPDTDPFESDTVTPDTDTSDTDNVTDGEETTVETPTEPDEPDTEEETLPETENTDETPDAPPTPEESDESVGSDTE